VSSRARSKGFRIKFRIEPDRARTFGSSRGYRASPNLVVLHVRHSPPYDGRYHLGGEVNVALYKPSGQVIVGNG